MFDKILIANRGEIACRVIRTARRLGMKTVAIYSEADVESLHVRLADEAVCVGPAAASDSYLSAERVLAAARNTGAQAIHPGYGFMSENAGFAEACAQAGIVFIGPTPQQMRDFGLKHTARVLAQQADVPLLSGPAIPLVGDLMRYTISPLVTRMLWRPLTKRVFSPQPVDARFRELPVWMLLRPSQLRASAAETALMVPSAVALSRHYPELKVPVVVMAGTKDKIVDFGHNSERLDERLPDSELQLQPGVGHMTHYAHPEKVLAAVDEIAGRVGESVYRRNPQAEALARASESGT